MAGSIKHFSLHHIAGTELRAVSNVEVGVLRLIEVEEAVIRGYAEQSLWPHKQVTLFILQDLSPLVRQLSLGGDLSSLDASGRSLPPGGIEALNEWPVVNVYDVSDPVACHIFVNKQVMVKEGYWNDCLIMQGLLAHEHAHPLVDNETTRASSHLQVEVWLQSRRPAGGRGGTRTGDTLLWTDARQSSVHSLLTLLAHKLCLYAPREVLSNEVVIQGGFAEALLRLVRRNLENARLGLAGRGDVRLQLQEEIAQGKLNQAAADLLLLIADLRGYLEMALEIAPFYRTGREADGQELEKLLETQVFPHLEPEVPQAYAALRQQYIALGTNLVPPEVVKWSQGVLSILAGALATSLEVQYHLRAATG